MKRLSLYVLVALLVVGLTASIAAAAPKVGVVFSIGGLGDQSFNDAAYRGLQQAGEDFGIEYSLVEPNDIAEMEDHQRAYAAAGYDLVIGVGFLQEGAMDVVSQDYPNVSFAIIDSVVPRDNVASLTFKEHEGSFLVGLVAGMMTETNTVGFVGGMEVPVIRKFQTGYEDGVRFANPDAQILVNYAGSFGDPGRGKELAISQNERNADIVYHASGGTGMGVIEAAEEFGFYAIGVDSVQDHLAPGTILTSMIKRVDVAVYEIIEDLVNGEFAGGVHAFGIAEGGVGTSEFEFTKDIVPDEVFAAIKDAKAKIISGELVVDDPTQ